MNETNELNDIILNKGGSTNNNKKIILAVATLGVILIIVVMLMNSLTSSGTDNLPQAVLPPKATTQDNQVAQEEPLFEEVEVLEEISTNNDDLDKIARKLKEESQVEVAVIEEVVAKPEIVVKPKTVVKTKKIKTPKKEIATRGAYYIQVGSFSKYEPNKKFLKSISALGYAYKYHKVTRNSKTLNKVLVGPFDTSAKAKDARRVLRAKVEPGAFLIKL